jgi:S-disulfanyl-L-cysteine oxidoreductase SoxD
LTLKVALFASVCALVAGQLALAQPDPILSGIFTKPQAERGKSLYEASCASCHGVRLVADDPTNGDLTGLAFRLSWQNQTLDDKFESCKVGMPPGRGGFLTDQEYLDVVTYILSFNGYPAGDKELTPDRERLKQITIVPIPR